MDGGGAASSDSSSSSCTSPWPSVPFAPAGNRVESCSPFNFKSRLHEYTHKACIPAPEYHTLKEGGSPSGEPGFKSTVFVNDARYESLPGFFRRKAAQQSAAEAALLEIALSAPVTETRKMKPQETGLCKNLLQEYAQKMNSAIPSYIFTHKQALGVAHFICSVDIGGILYIGAVARTKKAAAGKAAQTTLLAIQGQSEGGANGTRKYIVVPGQRPDKETDKKPIETPIPLKVRIPGFMRKWNKRKFMGMADQTVDAEKDLEFDDENC